MAKLFRCWVIVDGSVPTSFRSRDADELLPTLKQLQRTQPDVVLKWFERGRFWTSPDEAAAALLERRRTAGSRGREWRPGGDHKDPRAKYDIARDEKRALYKKRLISRKTRDAVPRTPGAAEGPRRPPPPPPGGRPPRAPSNPWRPSGPTFGRDSGRATGRRPPPPRGGSGSPTSSGRGPAPAARKPFGDRPKPPGGAPRSRPPGAGSAPGRRPMGGSRPPKRRNDK